METTESKEMYLETILKLHLKGARVKAVDVAAELGFSRPSVSNAVKTLVKEGYITVGEYAELVLTEKGMEKAISVYDRHCVLKKLLTDMGAKDDVAEENACRIEHVIDDEVFALIKKYVNKE